MPKRPRMNMIIWIAKSMLKVIHWIQPPCMN
uniref:Uncharacterized protein n=1 Tax=Rhizophora mucronata TaxID=61149 RepID=A0A2P2NIG9_RHIMU